MTGALLTIEQMYAADKAAIEGGVPGAALMEHAGSAVADAVSLRWGVRPVTVLCGPGNNGGDGFVAARRLKARGWPVSLHLLGDPGALKGDAAHHAALWDGPIAALLPGSAANAGLVVDAIFGAGLRGSVHGVVREALEAIPRDTTVIAVDVPSGIHGDSGQVLGYARRAEVTVTFFRGKPGHYLMPGKALAGEVVVADIGIPPSVLHTVRPTAWLNDAHVWGRFVPRLCTSGHKFDRGQVAVIGGAGMTGAARLAGRAALHAGAGLVTVLSPPERAATYRSDLAGLIVCEVGTDADIADWFGDTRRKAAVVGPGLGRDKGARRVVATVLEQQCATVIDADGLSSFAGAAPALASLIRSDCVVTPHAGEFARLFGEDGGAGKLERARAAASALGAVVVFKGPDTVIAAPDGRAAINDGAPPELAVAGSGDVLSGMIGAALAMGVPPFEGAALAVSAHGRAGHAMARSSADALGDAVRPLWERSDAVGRHNA